MNARTDFCPAQAAIALIRDMHSDPTDEQLKGILAALGSRLKAMHDSGRYTGLESLICAVDDAHDATDEVQCLLDGVSA
jgi:hypothetical protein